jgi:hypothetical protein
LLKNFYFKLVERKRWSVVTLMIICFLLAEENAKGNVMIAEWSALAKSLRHTDLESLFMNRLRKS